MKLLASTALLTVAGAAVASGDAIEKQLNARQIPGLDGPLGAIAGSLMGSSMMSGLLSSVGFKPAPVAKIVDVKPLVRPEATRKLIRYGPFTLPPFKGDDKKAKKPMGGMGGMGGMLGGGAMALLGPMDPDGITIMKQLTEGIPSDSTYLSARTSIVYENGNAAQLADGVYLHHAIAIDLSSMFDSKADNGFVSFCSGKLGDKDIPSKMNLPIVFGGAVDPFTQWYTSMDGKFNSGYYLGKNEKLMLQGEMVNYSPKEQQVYVQFDVEYVPGKVGTHATQTFLSVNGCDLSKIGFKPATGNGTIISQGFPVYKDGYILSSRGHVHDGGTSVMLYLNDQLVCSSDALYGGKAGTLTVDGKEWATLSKMTDCVTKPLLVKKGDIIKIGTSYDTIAHPLRDSDGEEQEEMAVMYFNFAPKTS